MSLEQIATDGAGLSRRVITKQIEVSLPRDQVWAMWTSEEGLARWLVRHSRIALAVGGPYEFYFNPEGPEGERGGEGNVVLSFLPPRMLSFTWNAPPQLATTRHQRTWVLLELDQTESGTQVTLTHTGWPAEGLADPESAWSQTFDYFDRAWGSVMGALAAHAAG